MTTPVETEASAIDKAVRFMEDVARTVDLTPRKTADYIFWNGDETMSNITATISGGE